MLNIMRHILKYCNRWTWMRKRVQAQNKPSTARQPVIGLRTGSVIAAALLLVPWSSSAQVKAPATYDPAFVEQILKRLEVQEKELKELRASRDSEAPADEPFKRETFPSLSFHGFGDISYIWDNEDGERRNSFALGQLDFFVTSKLSDDLTLLSETVIEADSMNNFVIEIERLLLQWRPSDYFNVDIGRYHTAVGYYNTAFHHGAWFDPVHHNHIFWPGKSIRQRNVR